MDHPQCIVSALQALVGGALLACIALSDGCQMHDLQPSSRARRMYRRLSLSSTHCITLLAQKRPARANRTQIESCRSLTRTQSPRLIKQILRIQNKISYAYELLRNGWAQRTISRAVQECYNFVPRHVSRKALNYMHTEYLKIDF